MTSATPPDPADKKPTSPRTPRATTASRTTSQTAAQDGADDAASTGGSTGAASSAPTAKTPVKRTTTRTTAAKTPAKSAAVPKTAAAAKTTAASKTAASKSTAAKSTAAKPAATRSRAAAKPAGDDAAAASGETTPKTTASRARTTTPRTTTAKTTTARTTAASKAAASKTASSGTGATKAAPRTPAKHPATPRTTKKVDVAAANAAVLDEVRAPATEEPTATTSASETPTVDTVAAASTGTATTDAVVDEAVAAEAPVVADAVVEAPAAPASAEPVDEAEAPEEAPGEASASVEATPEAPAAPTKPKARPVRRPASTRSPEPVIEREPGAAPSAAQTENTGEAPVVLSLTGLVKQFGETRAVDGIDLEVRRGSFYGIVGPNGAGKTTTLSMVTGLLRPDAGSITVQGIDVWQEPEAAKRSIGVLPDRLRLFDRLTGNQLLYYSGVLRGLDPATVRSRTNDLATAFGLDDALGRLVTDYSAGMTKKIALAAALIHSPRLLILDEPFESVDPVSAANVIEILQKYVANGGTVVLSSHGMDFIQRVCDHVAIIVQGKVLASGSVDDVRGSGTLEERFVELAGGRKSAEGMEWLHSFSD
ncbi:ATP-binding cassette domain-containing protein [Plantibacter sp. Mn2098]|uniref:ABC transporter ATP-binding protein n=1 Tax=Plantibacter sp. Mn2098 TaxID=3395266 RepID=UPI003BE6EDB0